MNSSTVEEALPVYQNAGKRNMRFDGLNAYIRAFSSFEGNRDSYQADPISPLAFSQAHLILAKLEASRLPSTISSSHVFPMQDGGIQFHPDSNMNLLDFDEKGDLREHRPFMASKIEEIIQILRGCFSTLPDCERTTFYPFFQI